MGFWEELSVYNKFNSNPNGMCTYSWEDWAQYQITADNDLMARSKHPRALERVRSKLHMRAVETASYLSGVG